DGGDEVVTMMEMVVMVATAVGGGHGGEAAVVMMVRLVEVAWRGDGDAAVVGGVWRKGGGEGGMIWWRWGGVVVELVAAEERQPRAEISVSDQRPPNQIRRDIYPFVLGKLEQEAKVVVVSVGGKAAVGWRLTADEDDDGDGGDVVVELVAAEERQPRWVVRRWCGSGVMEM
ncbi:hypothetical protein Tco_0863506, partial [Tanacetum coccineum]